MLHEVGIDMQAYIVRREFVEGFTLRKIKRNASPTLSIRYDPINNRKHFSFFASPPLIYILMKENNACAHKHNVKMTMSSQFWNSFTISFHIILNGLINVRVCRASCLRIYAKILNEKKETNTLALTRTQKMVCIVRFALLLFCLFTQWQDFFFIHVFLFKNHISFIHSPLVRTFVCFFVCSIFYTTTTNVLSQFYWCCSKREKKKSRTKTKLKYINGMTNLISSTQNCVSFLKFCTFSKVNWTFILRCYRLSLRFDL